MNELILGNLQLAKSLAIKYAKTPDNIDDLYQEACCGLVEAANSFDENRGVQFNTYAFSFMMKHIYNALGKDIIKKPRELQELARAIDVYKYEFAQTNCRFPTLMEIANGLEIDPAEVQRAAGYVMINLETPIGEEEDDYHDIIEGSLNNPAQDIEGNNYVEYLLNKLPPKQREVIELKYLHDWTQQEIAKKMSCSQQYIAQLELAALTKLRKEVI